MAANSKGRKKPKKKSAAPGTLKNKAGEIVCGSAKANGSDTLCDSPVVMANGRCKKHGGKSAPAGPAHHSYVHGHRSKVRDALPKRLQAGFDASVSDPELLSVRTEMGVLDARTIELYGTLSTDLTSIEPLLDDLHDELQAGVEAADLLAKLTEKVDAIRQALLLPTKDRAIWSDIIETMGARRKLTDTERRLLEMKQAVVDVGELRTIVAFILQSVKEHVIPLEGGRKAVSGVANDIGTLLRPSSRGLGGGPTGPAEA